MLQFEHEKFCADQLSGDQIGHVDSLETFREGVDDGAEFGCVEGDPDCEIDVSNLLDDLDESGYGWSEECFADLDFNLLGNSFTIPFSLLCSIMDVLGIMILLGAAIMSGRIILGAL
jgi:hypothetical protein